MKSYFRIQRSSRAWCRLAWNSPEALANAEFALALDKVAVFPGVRVNPQGVELPITTWMLPEVVELLGVAGAPHPRNEARLYTATQLTRPLYSYQEDAKDRILLEDGFLLADEPGLGKTSTAIATAAEIQASWDRPVLILGPLFTRDVWLQELLATGAIQNETEFYAFTGRDPKTTAWSKTAKWYFIHYDIVAAWWNEIYWQIKPCAAVLDEAHWIKNGRAKRSKGALLAAGTVGRRILLTGTPIDNQPSDLWNLLTLTTGQQTWGDPISFRQRYCGATYTGFGYQDDLPTHVDELRARMAPFFLRREVKDVAQFLPDFTRQLHLCDLAPTHAREHKAVLSKSQRELLVRALMQGSMSDEALSILTRLRQITSDGKIPDTVEFVSNLREQGESCVVFVWERRTADKLVTLLCDKQHPVPWAVTGELEQYERASIVSQFQATKQGVIIATYGALREGVTLHASRFVVMHDLSFVLTHILQAEKRVHRIGQKWPCQSHWMVARDSIDTILAPILLRKSDAMKGILDVETNLEDLNLAELVGIESFETQVASMLKQWEEN